MSLTGKFDCCEKVFKDHSIFLIELSLSVPHFFPLVIGLSVYYLGFLLPHAMDAGCQLDSIERVGVVGWGIRNVCDHGGSAVDVAQGLPQQHGQFAVPADQ